MSISDKVIQLTCEKDLQKQLELIDTLTVEEAREIIKAFVRFTKREQPEI